MPNLTHIAVYFSPELILVAGALLVVVYDLIVRRHGRGQAGLAAATVLVALTATLCLQLQPAIVRSYGSDPV